MNTHIIVAPVYDRSIQILCQECESNTVVVGFDASDQEEVRDLLETVRSFKAEHVGCDEKPHTYRPLQAFKMKPIPIIQELEVVV